MNTQKISTGFTLVELMVTLAIIGVLSAVAIPAYNGYIAASKAGVALTNAESLAGFQRTHYYEYDTFVEFVYDGDPKTIPNTLEWLPKGDNNQFKYDAAACSGNTIKNCVDIKVSYLSDPSISQTVSLSP